MDPTATDETNSLTAQQRSALRALAYSDIFSHPLRQEEIAAQMDLAVDKDALCRDLRELCAEGTVIEQDGYFGFGDIGAKVRRRIEGNVRAERRMTKARRMSRLIGHFPFVRAVMLSGSISKGYLDVDGDIDYFVITAPGRLWIARTLLIAFKKLVLLNSHRNFCLNYFIDTDHLTIEDRNRFTATEVMTLVPTFNTELCARFFAANTWAQHFLPNKAMPTTADVPVGIGLVKRMMERAMRNGFGDEIDAWCMWRTADHWRRKFPEFDRERFELALRSRSYVSKHHPRDFQSRVLNAFAERVARLPMSVEKAIA